MFNKLNWQSWRYNETAKASIFAAFLLLSIAVNLVIVYYSSGPLVLGTEMNTNGLVEYLCLGNGCERIP
jgi:hypothetical protein